MAISKLLLIGLILPAMAVMQVRAAARFFNIGDPKPVERCPIATEPLVGTRKAFRPYLEIPVSAADPIPTPGTFVRIHYFNDARRLIATTNAPEPRNFAGVFATLPAFFPKDGQMLPCGFVIPPLVRKESGWSCVIVVGDAKDATARVYPSGVIRDYEFPEKEAAANPVRADRERILSAPQLAEKVISTGYPDYPRITVFLKRPASIATNGEARGVLAMCLLGNSVDAVKRRLLLDEERDDVYHLLKYAERRKLLVLCWGARKVWDNAKDWDQLSPEQESAQSRVFNKVADAWERGVKEFAREQQFESKNMLLWGYSASAQYAKRLALRKPDLFRAVYLHIPSSFDKPTPEGKSALWCVTTGELDYGYEGSAKFFQKCRELNYPIFYKVIPKLGHRDSVGCHRFARQFFDYALMTSGVPKSYANPEFYADWLNQSVMPATQAEWIPEVQRVPLPDAQWAAVWEQRGLDKFEEEERAELAAAAKLLANENTAKLLETDRIRKEAEVVRLAREESLKTLSQTPAMVEAQKSFERLFNPTGASDSKFERKINEKTGLPGTVNSNPSPSPQKSAIMIEAEKSMDRFFNANGMGPEKKAEDPNSAFGRKVK